MSVRNDTTDTAAAQALDDLVAGLNTARRAVYDTFVAHGPMTDDELAARSGIPKPTSSPRRGDLVKLGLVEASGKVTTARGTRATLWALVPPDRVAAARAMADARGPRTRPVTDYPLAVRLEIVRQLLDMDDLNDAIRDSAHGRAWSRVRGRANDRRGERNRELRDNAARLREAEERGAPIAEFFKLRRILLQSSDRVDAAIRLVNDELERRYSYGQQIPVGAWPGVADLLNDLARRCDDANAKIRQVMGDLGDDVIDAEVIEIEDLMLPEGDSGEADVP
jgi:hypothetical protein